MLPIRIMRPDRILDKVVLRVSRKMIDRSRRLLQEPLPPTFVGKPAQVPVEPERGDTADP